MKRGKRGLPRFERFWISEWLQREPVLLPKKYAEAVILSISDIHLCIREQSLGFGLKESAGFVIGFLVLHFGYRLWYDSFQEPVGELLAGPRASGFATDF